MNKLHDLRAYLISRIPDLQRNPERLLTFVEDGRIVFHKGENYSHRYKMPVRIVVTDWRSSADDIVLPVLEWLSVRETDWDPDTAITFESEIINKESVDISLTLNINERVIVSFEDGQRTITHVLPEPPLQMDPDAEWQFFVSGPPGDHVIPEPDNG